MRRISLFQQIHEIEQILVVRDAELTKAVSAGRMRESVAEFHRERLNAVRATLIWLHDNEQLIKQRCGIAHA